MTSQLLQLHWQFKDGTTEMRAQKELSSFKEEKEWTKKINESHPLPDGAIWMMCNEKSEYFVKIPI